ncbi:hypothetical protein PYW07_006827 [Mythimna separata]|uniref:Uncharacterized protein n=1 Tax=Mythimna separata TaxID=271217 RepID=A0AAD8DRL9_MYTSE|nr:hypothetical protein PYW07_006129 [Mythimna separata]KAJ8735206.1 hypothetical protein PYW07_006826 [Mythimna separata]KAJ8735207.1 hypothetical protein PYW07_006827 [Mythimna separata]
MEWTDSCRPVFKSYNLLTAPCIYIYEIAKFVKSNFSIFEPKNNNKKRKATHYQLQLPVPKIELFRRSCVYMAPLIYNSIPNFITDLPYGKFCKVLKKWLVSQSFYSLAEFLKKGSCQSYHYRNVL